jgi:hypothetical protein
VSVAESAGPTGALGLDEGPGDQVLAGVAVMVAGVSTGEALHPGAGAVK